MNILGFYPCAVVCIPSGCALGEYIQLPSGTNPIHPRYPWYNYYMSPLNGQLRYNGQESRSQMNSLCTKQPLNKGHLCITAKMLVPKEWPL